MAAQSSGGNMTITSVIDSLEKLMERKNIPGLMLTIIKNDSVSYSGGLGLQDKERNLKADENTLFRLGSVTKSFVALGILRLIKEGKFSLDDEVKKLAPEVVFDNAWEPGHPVRVRHLLSHTAGFDDMHFRELYNTTENPDFPLEKVLQMSPATLRVRWQPGTRYSYSNPGWTIAGYLIEKFSGVPYDEYITREVLLPLGMVSSNFESVPSGEQYAKGYNDKGKEVPFLPIYHRPAGAFNSNAKDMTNWLQFFLRNVKADTTLLLTESELTLMEEPIYTVTDVAGLTTGYGLGNYTFDKGLPLQFHGHDGGIDGFISAYAYNRQHGLGFAISNNGSAGMADLVNLIKAFLTQELPKTQPEYIPLDAVAMQPFLGFYTFKASRNQLFAFSDRLFASCDVTIDNDTLYLKTFGQDRYPVLPVKNSKGKGMLFAGVRDQYASHVFTLDANGQPVMGSSAVGNYLEKADYSGVLTKRILLFGSLSFLLVAIFATVVWFIFAIRKTLTWTDFFKRSVPSVAGVAVILVMLGMLNTLTHLEEAGMPNTYSLMIYLGTWVVIFCAFLSARFAIMSFKAGKQLAFSIFYVFLAFSTVMMALFIYDAGWMGLKMWEY